MTTLLAPLHMGQLHAYEQALVYLLAFGPFVLLAVTIWISRRRAGGTDTDERTHDTAADTADQRH